MHSKTDYSLFRKYEEIYPPDVGEFVYITDDTYTKKQVLRMEHLILKVLNFDVAVPTSIDFLKRYLKSADADKKTEHLAYVSEMYLTYNNLRLFTVNCCFIFEAEKFPVKMGRSNPHSFKSLFLDFHISLPYSRRNEY